MRTFNYNMTPIANLLGTHKIFVDTCSLMHTEAASFFGQLTPMLQRYGKKINVPSSVFDEIIKNQQSTRPLECRTNAKAAQELVNSMLSKGVAQITANSSETTFADFSIGITLKHERLTQNLVLITQDKALAKDSVMGNFNTAVRGGEIKVMKLTCAGGICEWDVCRLLEEIRQELQEDRTRNHRPQRAPSPHHSPAPRPSHPSVSRNAHTPAHVNSHKATSKSCSQETCIDCGSPFTVSVDEARSLMLKGLNFPKRCHACRARRRAQNAVSAF